MKKSTLLHGSYMFFHIIYMINFTKKNFVTPEYDCYFFLSDLNTEIVFFQNILNPHLPMKLLGLL